MVAKDLLQMTRKLKHPYVRVWYHGRGNDTYRQVKASKKKLFLATFASGDVNVAFRGKEYLPKEFLRKHPSFKLPLKARKRILKQFRK